MFFPNEHIRSFAVLPQQGENQKKNSNHELLLRYNEMRHHHNHQKQRLQQKTFTVSVLRSPEFQKKVDKIFKCLKSNRSKRNSQTQQLIRLCIETLRLSQQSRQLQRQIDQLKLETQKFLETVKPNNEEAVPFWMSSRPNSSVSVQTQQHSFSYPGSTDGIADGSVNHVMYSTRLTSMRLQQRGKDQILGTQIQPSPSSKVESLQTSQSAPAIALFPAQVQETSEVPPTPDAVPASPASDLIEIDDVQEPLAKVMELQQEESETSMDFRDSSNTGSSFSSGSSTSTSTSWSSNEAQPSIRYLQSAIREKKSDCSCCTNDMNDPNVLDFHSYLNRRAKIWIHSLKLTENMSLDSMPFNSLRPDGCGSGGSNRFDDERLIDAVVASKPAKKAKNATQVRRNLELET